MQDTSSNNKRILKNTVYLYVRMIFSMLVTLYTSRVILDVLGASDYGIYNVIGGIVVLISLINNSMTSATQRFITYELGKQDLKKVSDTFSMSMTAHFAICILVLLLGETIGLYYVANYLNVPADRHTAAMWVYQFSLLAIVFNILRIPYNASVIAYEKMDFYAVISIIEVVMKLLIVYLLLLCSKDKLIFYAILVLASTALFTFLYKLYCQKKFSTCRYYWVIDQEYLKKLFGFFGWNFVGTVATAGTHQVGNIILNAFCGTVINAAYGIANQVNVALNSLSSNFQVAYTPQIVKLYSQERRGDLFTLMNRSALLSYYLLFIVAIPIFLHIDLVLGIWLKEVPTYAGVFCQWLIIYNLIDSVQAPLWKVITATGNIKKYEIWLTSILLLNIPFTYIALKQGYPPYSVVIISAALNLLTAIIRTVHVKYQVSFPVLVYLKDVVLRVLVVSLLYLAICKTIMSWMTINTFLSFLFFFCLTCIICILLVYAVGICKKDRAIVTKMVLEKLRLDKQQS